MRYSITITFNAADPNDAAWLHRVTVLRYATMKTYETCGITNVVVSELERSQ